MALMVLGNGIRLAWRVPSVLEIEGSGLFCRRAV